MNPEAVLVSYSHTEKEDGQFKNTHFTASGIKFEERWVLTHGYLVSALKTASEILKSEIKLFTTFPEDKYYQRLPRIYVTSEKTVKHDKSLGDFSKDDSNDKNNFLNNVVATPGKIKLIWRSKTLGNIIDKLFASWTIGNKPGNSDSQDDSGKNFLPAFVLIDIGYTETNMTLKEVLTSFYQYVSNKLPQRSDELIVFGTPFGNEVFLNSMTKGAVSNVIGRTSDILLCDAPTSVGFEGGPVFLKKTGNLLGITISSLSWCRGEWVGITLIASLKPLFHEILYSQEYKDEILSAPKDLPFVPLLAEIDRVTAFVRCGESWGSGIFISKGYILTCSHCVKEHNTQRLSVYISGKTMNAKVLFRSRDNKAFDLALLSVDELDSDDSIQLAKAPAFKGETVVAVGFPYFSDRQIRNLKPTITKGTVNNITPYMIQTSCCVQSGYSGGAILRICLEESRLKCYLLGIIVCNAKDDDNHAVFPHLNMAVPVNAFQDVLFKFIKNPSSIDILRAFENPSQHVQSLWRLQLYNSNL